MGGEDLPLDALDREGEATALGIDLENLHLDLVTGGNHLTRVLDVVRGELGDVDQALHAVEDLDEGPEGDHLGDRTLEVVPDVVGVDHPLPGVVLGLLEAERDALALTVDLQDLDLDGVPDREGLAGVVYVRPGDLGDVDQAVDAVEVDEGAEVDDVGDLALHDGAGLELVEDLLPRAAALLLEDGAAREDDVVALPV